MAKNTAGRVRLRNTASGQRDYPLKDGSSVYLPPRGKGVEWPEIPEAQVSDAMRAAEKKGALVIEAVSGDKAVSE